MTNPTDLHDIIFVTGKYGRRNKTGDIEKLQYNSRKDIYYITYKDGKPYPCRSIMSLRFRQGGDKITNLC